MKPTCSLIAGIATIASLGAPVNADSPPTLSAGIGQWYIDVEGDIGDQGATSSLQDLGFGGETANTLWLNLDHSHPYLPHVQLRHTRLASDARSTITQEFRLGGIAVHAAVEVETSFYLTHSDIILFYPLQEEHPLSFDLGVNIRLFEGFVEVQSELTPLTRSPLEGAIPTLYIRSELQGPRTGWQLGGEASWFAFQNDSIGDFSLHLSYRGRPASWLGIGGSLGYRYTTLKIQDYEGLFADIELRGPYADISLHF